jgi:ferric-dicitrate binding protein FerR (iron transport regulator)
MELESDFEAGVRARKALIRRTLYRAGGVVLLLAALIVAYVFYFDFTQRTKYRADTNVAALIDLPDGSSVRLEPSGRLVHAKGMLAAGTGMQRWVDLQGTADFVVRNPDLANFSVIKAPCPDQRSSKPDSALSDRTIGRRHSRTRARS